MKNFTSIVYILIQTVVLAQSPKVELSVEPKTADVGEIITITVKSNVQGQVEIEKRPQELSFCDDPFLKCSIHFDIGYVGNDLIAPVDANIKCFPGYSGESQAIVYLVEAH